jgi:hypothetical protein
MFKRSSCLKGIKMQDKEIKKLPFWETIGRSFKYVLKNNKLLLLLLPITAVVVIIQALVGFPLMCAYNNNFCVEGWQNVLSNIVLVLVAVGIIINYCRSIICKENADITSLKFFKRMMLYVLWSFALTFVVGIPVAMVIVILSIIGMSATGILALTLFAFIVLGVFFAPLIVAFPALAVDDNKIIRPSKLYAMAKGNKMSIFFGQLVIMIPYVVLSNTFIYVYLLLGINNIVMSLLFVFVAILLSLLDASFRGAYFAHIYQFLKYYDQDK